MGLRSYNSPGVRMQARIVAIRHLIDFVMWRTTKDSNFLLAIACYMRCNLTPRFKVSNPSQTTKGKKEREFNTSASTLMGNEYIYKLLSTPLNGYQMPPLPVHDSETYDIHHITSPPLGMVTVATTKTRNGQYRGQAWRENMTLNNQD